ncbi:MAG: ATP-binding protein [Bacillota bacterium]
MRKKLLAFNIITSLVVLSLMFIGGIYISNQDNESYAESTAMEYAITYQTQYEMFGDIAVPENVSYRVTLIDTSGVVLFDNDVSSVASMENHLDRPEVISALAGNSETQIRYSETLDVDMVYYAVLAQYEDQEVIIRIAFSLASVRAYFYESMPILVLELILIGILGILMSIFFGNRTLRPLELVKSSLEAINRGEYSSIEDVTNDGDIDGLLAEINEINRAVLKGFAKVKSEQTKLNYVLDNIADGIVAINGRNQISTINKSAQRIFGVNEMTIGKPVEYLSGYSQFVGVMENKSDQIFELVLDKKIYLCFLNYLENPTNSFNRVLSIRDITERKNVEKMRSEFFANASHELKTPLTVVSGFMEILSLSTTDPRQADMLEKVACETQRMKTLIEDMLALSNLENKVVPDLDICNINQTCEEVFETLSIESYKKNIKLTSDCDVKIKISHKHLYELIKNLVENGVKYSKPNASGFVHVSAVQNRDKTRIVISDNGIGISKKHQDRIFERFYRVEKSRSRATGGTGLGLSIVKHIVDLYGGTYSLASTVGRGTTITIELPTM